MPTVLRRQGFRFYFFSSDRNEPLHVHVQKGDAHAKVWLEPVSEQYAYGFTPAERRNYFSILKENLGLIISMWDEHFTKDK